MTEILQIDKADAPLTETKGKMTGLWLRINSIGIIIPQSQTRQLVFMPVIYSHESTENQNWHCKYYNEYDEKELYSSA